MRPRAERVPVRWGFVLLCGVVAAAVLYGGFRFLSAKVDADPAYQKHTYEFIKRALGR